MCHMLLNEKLLPFKQTKKNIVGNVLLVDTMSLYYLAVGLDCVHSVSGLSWLLSLQEQPQLITIIATVWIPIMVMVIYFLLITAGSRSGRGTVWIMQCDTHSTSFDYRRQKKGGQRQIWWPCSSGGSTVVSRTSDRVSVYSSQHNEWSKVWFKQTSPDPSNCSPLCVITTVCAFFSGLHTDSHDQAAVLAFSCLCLISPC